jgi:DNA repair exonuclease SbcCD ATPase subunit
MNEFHNPNLAADSAKKIKIIEAIFEFYLTDNGRLFLQEETRDMKRHREMLLEKIAEFAEADEAQENVEYMEKAELLKEMITEINNRGPRLADAEGGWW